jgi:dolichol-phosphate mannosyltransferase
MIERSPEFSVVIPFFNEEGVLPSYLPEISAAMTATGATWEAIFVNDGSRDKTGELLERLTAHWSACRIIHHARNSGQAAALWTGFSQARAPWIITLDGDGQNAPKDIPRLMALRDDYDMVVGIRATRKDTHLRRAMSRIANRIRRKVLADGMSDSGCALKVFRREILGSFLPMRSLYSFMPAFAAHAGYKIAELPVSHRERTSGRSNYGFLSFGWRPLADMLSLWWISRRRIPSAVCLIGSTPAGKNTVRSGETIPTIDPSSGQHFAQPFTCSRSPTSPSPMAPANSSRMCPFSSPAPTVSASSAPTAPANPPCSA